MSPNVWGPPIWTLFHCLAEKIKEEDFPTIGPQVFSYIKQICQNLPCPDCTQHATSFLKKITPESVNTKQKLQTFLCIFHNSVNKRKNKQQQDTSKLARYRSLNLIVVFNDFLRVYNTRGNMKLLTDSFHRTQLTNHFKTWMTANIRHFSI